MISSKGISKHPPKEPPLDFERLREEGMHLLQKLSGKIWTDHNLHDPGITILEILCYALTDLGYQTQILSDAFKTDSPVGLGDVESSYSFKEDLLLVNPVTKNDFETFIENNFHEVTAAWIDNYPLRYQDELVNGGYHVALYLKPQENLLKPNVNTINLKVKKKAELGVILFDLENRRLQWEYIRSIESCTIDRDSYFPFEKHHCQIELDLEILYKNKRLPRTRRLKARINIEPIGFDSKKGLTVKKLKKNILKQLEGEEFLAALRQQLEFEKEKWGLLTQIRSRLLNYRNIGEHFIKFQIVSVQEIVIKGEVILEDNQLNPAALVSNIYDRLDDFLLGMIFQSKLSTRNGHRNILYGSNLIEELIKLPEIKAVELWYLNLLVDGVPTVSTSEESSLDCIQLKKFSHYVPKINRRKSRIYLKSAGDEIEVDLHDLRLDYHPDNSLPPLTLEAIADAKRPIKAPALSGIGEYRTIQDDFPKNYRLDHQGDSTLLPEGISIKVQQLKHYLFFFERILVDYAHRLAKFGSTLSIDQDQNSEEDEYLRLARSIPDLTSYELAKDLVDPAPIEEGSAKAVTDKHRLLDHMLARFATVYQGIDRDEKSLSSKIKLLKDIASVSGQRGLGIPLNRDSKTIWEGDLLSGFEKRIHRLLGINAHPTLQKLTEINAKEPQGFYFVEHLLLVQTWDEGLFPKKYNRAAELLQEYLLDLSHQQRSREFYSFQISIVLPAWYPAWNQQRAVIEKVIRAEVPAHILAHFHWLDKADLTEFEILFADWMEAILHLNNQ